MRPLCACLLILGWTLPAPAEAPTAKEARERWLKGNYDEARELYEALAKDAAQRETAAIGVSRCRQSTGDYDKALAAVEEALKASAKSAPLHARRAELLYLRGRWDDAQKAADQAIQLDKDQFLARWIRAQVFRDRGDLKQAEAEFRQIVRTYTERSDKDMEVKDPESLVIIGLAGCENARWNNLSDQFQFVLAEVYGEALKQDKNFWPAEYEAGALLLEKYNRGEALAAFDKALTINPNAAEAYVGKGIAALQKYEMKDAERFAERALKINPNFVEALLLRADIHLASGTVDKALRELEAARKVNPRDEASLGRLAACAIFQRRKDDFARLEQEAVQHDAKPGLFYQVLGERLEERRWYDDAEKYYKKASELRPTLTIPRNSLGLLYMRLGRETEARKLLTRGFQDDEFNVRVANTLKVLRHLDGYATKKTDHFVLRFDAKLDAYLADYMAEYLERIYADLSAKFGHEPKGGPILIEVFNSHQMFSGRTIALPDLHTIGACTGRMVAMVSPHGKEIKHPFNWARVLRHELVHVFNLDQTHFLVPHWLTEGLAVNNEGFPRPQQWSELLLERVPKGEVMNLDDIDLGFIRPRSPADWHMAYCQGQLYVHYLQEKFGPQAVGALMKAYGDGLETGDAIARACGTSKAEFEKGYRAYLDKVVRGLKGKPAEKALSFLETRAAYNKDPNNLDLAARLAEFNLKRDPKTARKLAQEVLAKKKNHPRASYVMAQLLRAAGEDEKALAMVEAAYDPMNPDPRVLELLGRTYFESEKFDRAAEIYEQARQAEPYESKWLVELARMYAHTKNTEKLIETLKELVPTDADDLDQRKRLARLLLDAGRHAEAERYAREALEIDVTDPDAEQCLGEALLGQKRWPGAIKALQFAMTLYEKAKAPEKANEARLKLAFAYQGDGQKDKALAEVIQVLARDPENEAAKKLKDTLGR